MTHVIQALRENCYEEGDSLLKMKDRGGLVKPSTSVVIVCEQTEKCFQKIKSALDGKLPHESYIDNTIGNEVLRALMEVSMNKVFNTLNGHILEGSVTDNHIITLIKTISLCYSKIRLHHLAKELNASGGGKNVRKQLTRLVLFKNQ